MHENLEVDIGLAECAHDHIATHARFDRDISARVGNSAIGRIVGMRFPDLLVAPLIIRRRGLCCALARPARKTTTTAARRIS